MKLKTFLPLLFLVALTTSCKKKNSEQSVIRPVLTQTVEVREKKPYLFFSGFSKSEKKIQVSFRVGGQVAELPIKVGEKLHANQLIARLDDQDYALQVQQVAAAAEQAQAKLKDAYSHYQRLKILYESESMSRQELEHARAVYDAAKAATAQVASQLDLAKKEQSYTILKGESELLEVAAKHVEVRENVQPGQPVATLISAQGLQVEVAVPESEIGLVKQGSPVDLFFSVYPSESFQGTVDEVGVSSPRNTAFPVTITLLKQDERLRAGMAVKARMEKPSSPASNMIWVSLEAIGHDDTGHFVYLFEEGFAKKIPVKLGELSSEGIEVTAGLIPGQKVIVAGLRFLSDKQQVKLLEKL
ncbi:efflux RND transporter periplasmic adaptor subunit [Simkania sp.]|uniref:efflux RND transporter periplasmic adaptor subunit n=1 Tax=Simkania sp. TaxID=34094 RepID=UPI003B51EF76